MRLAPQNWRPDEERRVFIFQSKKRARDLREAIDAVKLLVQDVEEKKVPSVEESK